MGDGNDDDNDDIAVEKKGGGGAETLLPSTAHSLCPHSLLCLSIPPSRGKVRSISKKTNKKRNLRFMWIEHMTFRCGDGVTSV